MGASKVWPWEPPASFLWTAEFSCCKPVLRRGSKHASLLLGLLSSGFCIFCSPKAINVLSNQIRAGTQAQGYLLCQLGDLSVSDQLWLGRSRKSWKCFRTRKRQWSTGSGRLECCSLGGFGVGICPGTCTPTPGASSPTQSPFTPSLSCAIQAVKQLRIEQALCLAPPFIINVQHFNVHAIHMVQGALSCLVNLVTY